MARVQGLESFKRKVTRLRKDIQPEVQAGLFKAGDIIIAEQERLAPFDSGELVRSLTRKLVRGAKSGNQTVQVSTDVFYAAWVEFGTASHRIEPKNRQALKLGEDAFAAYAEHPGTTAQPFFYSGYRIARKRARAAVGKSVREAVKKAVK